MEENNLFSVLETYNIDERLVYLLAINVNSILNQTIFSYINTSKHRVFYIQIVLQKWRCHPIRFTYVSKEIFVLFIECLV